MDPYYIVRMIRIALLATACLLAAPAFAQEQPLPRFEGLEMQLQREEQRQVDELERARQRERIAARIGNKRGRCSAA